MNWDLLFFGIFPYIAIALAIGVSAYRYKRDRFTYSSLSSQLLERKLLFWGSIPFHWGLIIILLGHFTAFLIPSAILAWNAVPLRLLILEGTGLAMAIWALGGLCVLIYRRISVPRIQAVSTPMDLLVLVLLFVSIATGIATAVGYRWGSNWFAAVISPYFWSLLILQPKLELIATLPFMVKLHAFNAFLLLAVFPFTRLVHLMTLPIGYLWRPWQIVSLGRYRESIGQVASLRPRPKVKAPAQPVNLPQPEAVPLNKPRAAVKPEPV